MALNPNYEQIGKAFTDQYYKLFDDPAMRPQLVNLYNVSIPLFSYFVPFLPKHPFRCVLFTAHQGNLKWQKNI